MGICADQLFAIATRVILQMASFQTPEELLDCLDIRMRAKIKARGEELGAYLLTAVRDFTHWLRPMQKTLHNGFATRGGIESAHSFTYKTRSQV